MKQWDEHKTESPPARPNGSKKVQSGQAHVTMSYDGRGRRITKSVTNAGQWDCTYHYYYDNDSLVETRNGSDQAIKHHVWGTRYIDELCQVTVLGTPGPFGTADVHYWACQDSNYNVLGVVDGSAVLAERYEYTPYGQRTAFFSPGSNDVGCYAPTQTSRRVSQGGVDKPFGICEVGHQGLVHDEEVGLVYNRARQLHPGLGRFVQRDPLGYVDGGSLYQYVRGRPTRGFDPTGMGFGCSPAPIQNPRTDAECCAATPANQLGDNPEGWIVCCDGSNRACENYGDGTNPTATPIIKNCIKQHERTHFDDPDCKCPSNKRGPVRCMTTTAGEECVGYSMEHTCLLMNLHQCGGDQGCLDALWARIHLVHLAMINCCYGIQVPGGPCNQQ